MIPFRHEADDDVTDAIEHAAHDACAALATAFPFAQDTRLSRDFQSRLVDTLTELLKGHSLLDRTPDATRLPTLLVGDDVFGQPNPQADGFLVARHDSGALRAMDIEQASFQPLSEITANWRTFEDAAEAARDYCREQDLSLEAVLAMGLTVLPVIRTRHGYDVCPSAPVTQQAR